MRMASTSWEMSRGKLNDLHLRFHDLCGLWHPPTGAKLASAASFEAQQILLIAVPGWAMRGIYCHGNGFQALGDVRGQVF